MRVKVWGILFSLARRAGVTLEEIFLHIPSA